VTTDVKTSTWVADSRPPRRLWVLLLAIPVAAVIAFSVSFDPEVDTPARLRAYAEELGAGTSAWHFVTGEPDQLKNMIGGGFGVFYSRRDDRSYTFDPVFALVDGWGILRAVYRTPTPDVAIVARDIRLIVHEARNSRGASRYAYEAAHLFLRYPR
jgi:protein SCO1/2